MENTEITDIAEDCLQDFRNVIAAPLYYTEANEDGSFSVCRTNLGENLYSIIIKNIEKYNKCT